MVAPDLFAIAEFYCILTYLLWLITKPGHLTTLKTQKPETPNPKTIQKPIFVETQTP